jgi:hypothetical protein
MQILIAKSEATILSSRQGASGSRLQYAFALFCFHLVLCSPRPSARPRPSAAQLSRSPAARSTQHAARFHFGWRALPSLVDSLRAQALLVAPFLLYRRSAIGIISSIVFPPSTRNAGATDCAQLHAPSALALRCGCPSRRCSMPLATRTARPYSPCSSCARH